MSAAANTKVERVVEAFEAMAVAVSVASRDTVPSSALAMFDDVANARREAADALREFLKPTLRVVGE